MNECYLKREAMKETFNIKHKNAFNFSKHSKVLSKQ